MYKGLYLHDFLKGVVIEAHHTSDELGITKVYENNKGKI